MSTDGTTTGPVPADPAILTCPACTGTGRDGAHTCGVCLGRGLVDAAEFAPADASPIVGPDEALIVRQPCNDPAPLVVNGATFAGCQLPAGHDGQHQITIGWGQP